MRTNKDTSKPRIDALMRDPKAIRWQPKSPPTDGDYVVFIDESGDPHLDRIDPLFPELNLVAVLIRKEDYLDHLLPQLNAIKLKFFNTTQVVLHESEMRHKQGTFRLLEDQSTHYRCVNALLELLTDSPIRVIAASINKQRLLARYARPYDPYDLAMRFCLERIQHVLNQQQQRHLCTQVIFESRGKRLDQLALAHWSRIRQAANPMGPHTTDFLSFPMEPLFIAKKANVAGLQIADLIARPIARESLEPGNQARVMRAISNRLIAHKIFPRRPYCVGKTRFSPSANSRQATSYPDQAVLRTTPSASAHTSI